DVGAVDYLIKPLDAETVRKKVAVFVALARQRDEIAWQAERLREGERREYELRLAEMRVASDRRYRKLISGIDHAIAWTTDEFFRFTFVSEQAEKILGYSLDEFMQPDFWERHLHPGDRQTMLAMFQTALQGTDTSASHRVVAADGRSIWFHSGMSGALDEVG